MIVDIGSDITWVSCIPCEGCPTFNKFGIALTSYDPYNSTSSSRVSCSHHLCMNKCPKNHVCTYEIIYGNNNMTKGFLVSDTFHFDTLVGGSATTYSSTSVLFGCTNYRSGKLAEYTTVDGILGLGHMPLSIISQLSSPGIIPNVFSHCLRGDNGGGILVLGEIVEPGIIYTPLVPSRPAYNVNLQSIALNGEVVKINPAMFAAESGTIVDSGTTIVVFAEKAYDPFINSLISFVSQFARSVLHKSTQCFQVFNRAHENFPRVNFNFEGSESMTLEPKDYILWNVHDDIEIWCTGFQKGHGKSMNIIGEIMLKDKIVVYDLSRQRVGWVKYNCSQSVNVSGQTPMRGDRGVRAVQR